MKFFWHDLEDRERKMILAGIVSLVVIIGYFLGISPLWKNYQLLNEQVPALKKDLAWMKGAAGEVAALRRAGPRRGADSPLKTLDRTARKYHVSGALKRVEPAAGGQVKIWFEGVMFVDMIRWLQVLSRQYRFYVDELAVDRLDRPGLVNARLTVNTHK